MVGAMSSTISDVLAHARRMAPTPSSISAAVHLDLQNVRNPPGRRFHLVAIAAISMATATATPSDSKDGPNHLGWRRVAGAHQIAGAGTVANGWHIAGTGISTVMAAYRVGQRQRRGRRSGTAGQRRAIAKPARCRTVAFYRRRRFDSNGKSDILWVNDNGAAAIWDNGQGAAGAAPMPARCRTAGILPLTGDATNPTATFSGSTTTARQRSGTTIRPWRRYIANRHRCHGFHLPAPAISVEIAAATFSGSMTTARHRSDEGNIAHAHNVGDIANGARWQCRRL